MKKLVLIPFAFLVFIVAFAIAGPYFISTDSYRSWIEEKLADKIDAKVSIDKFRMRFIPYPGYTINGFKLISTSPEFSEKKLISVDRIEGSLSVIALIKGRIDTKIKVHGLNVDYIESGNVSNIGLMFGWDKEGEGDSENWRFEEKGEDVNGNADEMEVDENVEFKSLPAVDVEGGSKEEENTLPSLNGEDDSSFLNFESFFISEAIASNEKDESASVNPNDVRIRSIDVVGGTINFYAKDGSPPFILDSLEIAAKNLSLKSSGDIPGRGIFTADLKISASAFKSRITNVSFFGKVFYDIDSQRFISKSSRLYVAGSQALADIDINAAIHPAAFNLHLAIPAITPQTVRTIFPDQMKNLFGNLTWRGAVVLDVSASGSVKAYEMNLLGDASSAEVKYGRIFSKGPGLPLKFTSMFFVQEDGISLRETGFTLGEQKISVKGNVKFDQKLSASLDVDGKALEGLSLKTYFKNIPVMDSFEGLEVKMNLQGSLEPEVEFPKVNGDLLSKRIQLAGVAVDDFTSTFVRSGDLITIPLLKGKIAGGDLSSNASITMSEEVKTHYLLDGVIERIEIQNIPSLFGSIKGKGSLILHASTDGDDPLSITNNLKTDGSLIIPSGSWQTMKIGELFFTADTWNGLEALTGSTLAGVMKIKLGAVNDEFNDLNISYELSDGKVNVTSGIWENFLYIMEGLEGTLSIPKFSAVSDGDVRPKDSIINMRAKLILPKSISTQLITDEALRKNILDSEDRLILPLKISGSLKSPKVLLDHVGLAKDVEERSLANEKLEDVKEEEKSQKGGIKGKKTTSEKKSATPPARRGGYNPRKKQGKKDTEEILKVIIGH